MSASETKNRAEVKALLDELAETIHPWERGHAERVEVYAVATGAELGLSDNQLEDLRVAAVLHDIGKLDWPEGPWSEPDRKILAGETELARSHPTDGEKRLREAGFSEVVCRAVRDHHGRFDGSGYPEGNSGEISTEGRILAIVEFFDGVAHGPWSNQGADVARNWVIGCDPSLFGFDVYEAFLKIERLVQPVLD